MNTGRFVLNNHDPRSNFAKKRYFHKRKIDTFRRCPSPSELRKPTLTSPFVSNSTNPTTNCRRPEKKWYQQPAGFLLGAAGLAGIVRARVLWCGSGTCVFTIRVRRCVRGGGFESQTGRGRAGTPRTMAKRIGPPGGRRRGGVAPQPPTGRWCVCLPFH